MMRGRLRRGHDEGDHPGDDPIAESGDDVEIDARRLSGLFDVPQWLRGAGQASWLLVGVTVLLVGVIWLLALTNVIVLPLIAAGIVAAVASPLVAWMHRHGLPRGPVQTSSASEIARSG